MRKLGIVLGVAVLTSAGLFLLGVATSLIGNMGWIHLGEYQPWLPLIGLEYGFPLGIIIGVIVAVKKAHQPQTHGDFECNGLAAEKLTLSKFAEISSR